MDRGDPWMDGAMDGWMDGSDDASDAWASKRDARTRGRNGRTDVDRCRRSVGCSVHRIHRRDRTAVEGYRISYVQRTAYTDES